MKKTKSVPSFSTNQVFYKLLRGSIMVETLISQIMSSSKTEAEEIIHTAKLVSFAYV